MNKIKIFFFISIVFALSCCNGIQEHDGKATGKKCKCVNEDGVQVSIPEMPKEKLQSVCSQLGGQLQNCS